MLGPAEKSVLALQVVAEAQQEKMTAIAEQGSVATSGEVVVPFESPEDVFHGASHPLDPLIEGDHGFWLLATIHGDLLLDAISNPLLS